MGGKETKKNNISFSAFPYTKKNWHDTKLY